MAGRGSGASVTSTSRIALNGHGRDRISVTRWTHRIAEHFAVERAVVRKYYIRRCRSKQKVALLTTVPTNESTATRNSQLNLRIRRRGPILLSGPSGLRWLHRRVVDGGGLENLIGRSSKFAIFR